MKVRLRTAGAAGITGQHGKARHLGNGISATASRQRHLGNGISATASRQRHLGNGIAKWAPGEAVIDGDVNANLTDLSKKFDTSKHLRGDSDIVAHSQMEAPAGGVSKNDR